MMISPSLLGVRIEPGAHEVVFRYRSHWTKVVLFPIGVAWLIGLFVHDRRRRARSRSP
jgi:hypothetical protein